MSDTVIKVRGVGKKYHLGEKLPQRTLVDSFKTAAKVPLQIAKKMLTGHGSEPREEFWAVKDVSFDVKQGEVLGIIGGNGAGKSTLLKMLSRIVAPTTGEIVMTGRVGCLLEVGTGFHPELTGRENVYFNGSLLGMTKAEIRQKFDEIVDFSGVEKFLDTPVKFYSSGMYTRLAFSVAAHLNPEILIVDEVLAVGDAEFQKKCLGKMDAIAKSGRTVLFVSHNLAAVQTLCHKAILLENGRVTMYDRTDIVIENYQSHFSEEGVMKNRKIIDNDIHIIDAHSANKKIKSLNFNCDSTIELHIRAAIKKSVHNLVLSVHFSDIYDKKLFLCEQKISDGADGDLHYEITIPPFTLTPGRYYYSICLHSPNVKVYDWLQNYNHIELSEAGTLFPHYPNGNYGVVFVDAKWKQIPNS